MEDNFTDWAQAEARRKQILPSHSNAARIRDSWQQQGNSEEEGFEAVANALSSKECFEAAANALSSEEKKSMQRQLKTLIYKKKLTKHWQMP